MYFVQVEVGGNTSIPGGPVQFVPASISAPKGTVVTFRFSGVIAGNHTVTQSSFDKPCQLLDGGFDSGFIYVPSNITYGFPEWNLTITDDTKPIWYYCKQLVHLPHCTAAGMVGFSYRAINAPTSGSETFAAFQQAAKNSTGIPGQQEGTLKG
ncbi:hypothetical protein PILCRDRAFT_88015 [Piloderma croceum F 1598]|uniref:Plastocyanin-like domain-containing protein n=1 Tax=Piloderma croceum (strain F 1598) TaxID=765440 RepID=A0A0C3BBF0_PILCF|nr:hypothetical protein PILCRDRAFT_88015 [Piloderma croceum F 1598]